VKLEMTVQARVPVRIYFDDEAQNWHFHVPELHIVGGGQRTHDEARQAAAEAIAFALDSSPAADDRDGPIEYLNVAVG
jgi:predicted RNase H-like HicB family nuclease